MSADQAIHITVHLDKPTFRRFAAFDTFRRQMRWKLPAGFFLIMAGFAIFLFLQTDKAQSGLLGGVLLAVGLGLPAIYLASFYLTLRENMIKHRLPRRVYTLALTETDVTVQSLHKEEEKAVLSWNSLYMAYRVKGAVYLYALPSRAFLLPDGQADVPDDELWALLRKKLPEEKCRDLRKA